MSPISAHTRIYLTGFMGTGKSTLGPAVAQALGWEFVDLDDVIVREAGRPVPDLFAAEGEEGFRRREREALARVTRLEKVVVGLGGGAVLDPESRSLLLGTGTLVCLTARLSTLVTRLLSEAPIRPLLQDDGGRALEGDALAERIRALLLERKTAYASAHVTVDTDNGSIEETVGRIIDAVRAAAGASGDRDA